MFFKALLPDCQISTRLNQYGEMSSSNRKIQIFRARIKISKTGFHSKVGNLKTIPKSINNMYLWKTACTAPESRPGRYDRTHKIRTIHWLIRTTKCIKVLHMHSNISIGYRLYNGTAVQRNIDPIEPPPCWLVSVILFTSCVKKRKVRTDDKKRRIRD